MLPLAALFVSLTALLGCAASNPTPRYVVDVRRPRGLAPRQNIAGVMLDSSNDPPGTGIIPLALANDHKYVPSCPILARAASDTDLLVCLQLILRHHCCGEHQLQACRRHGILGHVHHFNRLSDNHLPFNSKVPSEISESHLRLCQRKHDFVQRELRRRNLCVIFVIASQSLHGFPNLVTRPDISYSGQPLSLQIRVGMSLVNP